MLVNMKMRNIQVKENQNDIVQCSAPHSQPGPGGGRKVSTMYE